MGTRVTGSTAVREFDLSVGPIRPGPTIWHLLAFLAAYVATGAVGQGLAVIPGVSITFWPPAGVFVGTLLLHPRSAWPWFVAVGGLAELVCNAAWFGNPVEIALVYYAANAIEAVVGAWLIERWVAQPFRFASLEDVARFAVLGGVVAPIVGATVIAVTDAFLDKHALATAWFLAWLGDGTGTLVATPLTLVAAEAWTGRGRSPVPRLLEASALLLTLLGVGTAALQGHLPTLYVTMPAILWAATRFQLKGAAASLGFVAALIAAFAAVGAGEFAGDPGTLRGKIINIQTFLGISTVSALLVAVLSMGHERALAALRAANVELESRVASRTANLRESEERLRLAAGVAGLGVLRIDYAAGTASPDAIAAEQFGLEAGAEVPLSAVHARFHADDRDEIDRLHDRSLEPNGDGSFTMDHRVVLPDGSTRWLSVRERVEFAEAVDVEEVRRPTRGLLAVVDVTARKEAEERLRESEAFARKVSDVAPSVLYVYDLVDQRNVWGNREMYLGLGYSREQLDAFSGSLLASLMHPADLVRYPGHAARLAALPDGEAAEFEYRLRAADGSWHWLVSRDMIFRRGEDGRPRQIIGAALDITERKRAEEELARSEAFARSVVEASADCIKGLTPDGRLLWMNECGRTLMEIPDFDSLRGRAWTSFWEAGGVQGQAEAALAEARAGRVGRFRGFCPTTAGTPRWWDVAVTPIPGPDGRVEQLLSVSRDVTEARTAEEALRESESFYRQTLESIPGMDFTNTPDGSCDYVSEQWVEFTGVPAAKQLGNGWVDVLHPDDRSRAFDAWRAAVEGRGQYDLEYRVRRANGDYEWFKVRGRAIRDASGAIARWFGTAVNVDDLKQAEAAILAHQRELQTIADNTPDVLTRFDRQFRHRFVNAAAETATGRTCAEIIGKTNRELGMPADLCDLWEGEIRAVFEAGQPRALEFSYDTPAGSRHYSSRLVPELGTAGEVQYVLGVAHDITERKQMEEALREADLRKDEFLAMLAHELRNPLAAICSAVMLLRVRGKVDPDIDWARDVIDRQSLHLTRLIDDLLDVSRITRGKIQLKPETLDLRDVAAQAVEAVRPLMNAKEHRLTLALPPAPLPIHGDPARLEQIVGNLLTNAAKYTDPGGSITLTASIEGDEAVVRVRDNGLGISAEQLPRIFALFAQVDASLDRAQGGLGIGLTLVKSLVEMHGGRVHAASDGPGLGSEFAIRLPLLAAPSAVPDPDPDPALHDPAPGPSRAQPKGAAPRRILVVDDNVDSAESLAMLLEVSGHEVRMAHDGPSALEAADEFGPDLVLLDIGLPVMSGYEVARALRARPRTAAATLVAVSGYGLDQDRRRSEQAGFDHHLIKPVDFAQLRAIVDRTVGLMNRIGE